MFIQCPFKLSELKGGWKNKAVLALHLCQGLSLCDFFFPTGYCKSLSAGSYTVGLRVGNCAGYGYYDCSTGWNSATHFIVEEITASPYD